MRIIHPAENPHLTIMAVTPLCHTGAHGNLLMTEELMHFYLMTNAFR